MKIKSDPPQVLEQPVTHTWATLALSPLRAGGSETKLEVYKITSQPRHVGGSLLLG